MGQYILDNLIFFLIIIICVSAIVAILTVMAVTAKKAQTEQAQSSPAPTADQPNQAAQPADGVTTVAERSPVKEKRPAPKAKITPNPEEEEPEEEDDEFAASSLEEDPGAPDRYSGKWKIMQIDVRTESGEIKESAFFFQLKASNGETLLTSEDYSSARRAIMAIDTFKSNIKANNFRISPAKNGKFTVKLLNAQGFLLARGEQYPSRYAATNAIGSIRRFAATAVRSNDVQHSILPYDEAPMPEKKIDESKKGRWLIRSEKDEETGEITYSFELRASNGQILLTSEEYTSMSGAKSGIVTHKNNIAAGNIRAAITRNGDYVLKVYTADGKLLALGEHYCAKSLCLSAIESVKRFAASAEIES